MTVQEMHKLMLAESAIVGQPTYYVNDLLVHDLQALYDMEQKGLIRFWWRIRECGTQFSSHSEHYMRLGFDNEQEHAYFGDLSLGALTKLEYKGKRG